MRSFPFPDKIFSREELTRDVMYGKIPVADRAIISDRAWDTGVSAALALHRKYAAQKNIAEIALLEGLEIVRVDGDKIAGSIRYFSEYFSKPKKIILYEQSVSIWAKKNKFSLGQAENLIISHEFFHHLECHSLGETSREYMIPTLRLGKKVLMSSGVRALSEIGAHGFSRTFYELVSANYVNDIPALYLSNRAMDFNLFEAEKNANQANLLFGKFLGLSLRKERI